MQSRPTSVRIKSLDQAELQLYRTLRRPFEHVREGIFVAEGEKVVRRLLGSDLEIVSMLMTEGWKDQLQTDFEARGDASFIVFIGDKSLLETIVGYNLHQGVMAVARVPAERSLEETIERIAQPRLLALLDGLVNAENVGVVVRNCAAFGVDAILVGERSSSPYLRRAVRNSMGAVFRLPIIPAYGGAAALRLLRQRYHTRTIAAHPHEGKQLAEVDLTGNICIVLGNEGEGISAPVLAECTERACIPMVDRVDSLNVASASAVCFYAAYTQRHPAT